LKRTGYEAPHYAIFSNLLDPNIPLSIPFSDTFNLCYSFNVKDQVSHPYRTYAFLYSDFYDEDFGPNDRKHYQNSISS
jgi:hypothetical protein